MNLPDYNFLSAPLWLVYILHIVTFTLHLIAMNFLVGGLIIILFGKVEDKWNNSVVQKFVKMFPNAMAATVTFGVAPLLFLQLLYPKQVYSAAIVSAWFWLMVVVAAIVSYYFLYAASFGAKSNKTGTYLTLAFIGFLYISFIYSSVFSLVERPVEIARMYEANQSGTIINTQFGSYIFRWFHMLLGAVTIGGFFVGLLGRNDEKIFSIGKNFYLWGMVSAMAVGLIYMFTLGEMLILFMRSLGIWTITLGLLLSLGSLHFFFKKKFLSAGLMLFISLLAMVITRHVLRLLYLDGYLNLESIKFEPQWSIFILFLICFVLAIVLVWYMLKLFFAKEETA
jgi:hypothetical protein